MKFLLTLLSIFATTFLYAQPPVEWIGGTPGQETSWHVARNWSNNRVPDENTKVIIKNANTGHYAQPVISQPVEVRSLEIHPGSSLQVTESGGILIDGSYTYSEGIQMIGGQIINDGYVLLKETDGLFDDSLLSSMLGSGMVMFDGQLVKGTGIVNK